ncbi:MAG TPA: PKD domain-containing protein [Solirubrobacteraceae bacterium]|nr:PKD domain-containing protein [Solirubrobacteraceae bacterium]
MLLLLTLLGATRAGATTFGGLGQVTGQITAGTKGEHGQVAPGSHHAFAVDPKTGNLFIVDEIAEEKHNHGRIQEFGPKGEFLGEDRFALIVKTEAEIGGIAIDSATGHVYVLVNEIRPPEEEIFDAERPAAGVIWSFSTEVKLQHLTEQTKLVGPEELHTLSEEPKAALLSPAGIAVDPKTGDIVIFGQQDESTVKGFGEEQLRAAVQRVHANGKLGPRYVDHGNCLDGAEPSPEEKASKERPCEERPAEAPRSPIVTPQGKVWVENENEIWEVPSPATGEEEFKEVVVHPKRIFTLGALQRLLVTGGLEEQAGTMSFKSLEPGKGTIYLTANIGAETGVSSESGVIVLDWTEGGGGAEVTERGWTGGENPSSPKHPHCAIPIANTSPLLSAGKGEEVFLFETTSAQEPPQHVDIFGFGPAAGAEPCGQPEVSPPTVEVGEEKDASKVETGKLTTIATKVTGANAKSTKWKLVFTPKGTTEKIVQEFSSGYQFEAPALSHEFTGVGEYEISATVETDNLGTPSVQRLASHKVTTTASKPKVKLIAPKAASVGEMGAFEATVTDLNASAPHLKYTWNFGDGSPVVVEKEVATKQTVTHRVEHAFASRCGGTCVVSVEVEDEAEKTTSKEKAEVAVGESAGEREARERAEQGPPSPTPTGGADAAAQQAAAAAQQQRELQAREKAEREHQEVLGFQTKHNPEAKLATTTLRVKKNGSFVLKVSCPGTEMSACLGTVTLRTATPVKVGKKKTILTLGSFSFSVAGNQTKTLAVRLTGAGRTLLLHSHSLRARATVSSHDSANVSRTTASTVTLRLAPH